MTTVSPIQVRSRVNGPKGRKWMVLKVNGRAKMDDPSKSGRSIMIVDGLLSQSSLIHDRLVSVVWTVQFHAHGSSTLTQDRPL